MKFTHRSEGRRTPAAARVRAFVSCRVGSFPWGAPELAGGQGPEPVVALTAPMARSDRTVNAATLTVIASTTGTAAPAQPTTDGAGRPWDPGRGLRDGRLRT